ncbi:helix-turn-helix domain-containing protein [Bacillus cereus group sp. MYBK69-1]|uniref:helix-turn-helix domain-containing protein n=1 Tax=unclassified Bacillus cereus group TaxID=2750818 RepID=UPI003F794F6A
MISYKPLLKLLIDKDIKKLDLKDKLGISSSTLAKFSKNEYISLSVIDKLCAYFNCQPSDLIEYIPDESGKNNS